MTASLWHRWRITRCGRSCRPVPPPVPSPLPLAALHEQPFVLYEDDFVLTGRILAACRQRGFVPAVAGQSRHWDFIGELVAAGTGVALLPSPVASRLDPARVRCVELDEPDLRWRLGWVQFRLICIG